MMKAVVADSIVDMSSYPESSSAMLSAFLMCRFVPGHQLLKMISMGCKTKMYRHDSHKISVPER